MSAETDTVAKQPRPCPACGGRGVIVAVTVGQGGHYAATVPCSPCKGLGMVAEAEYRRLMALLGDEA